MAFNPFMRRPADRPAHSKTFIDGPDTFTLTFRKPGQLENSAAFDLGEELTERYLGEDGHAGPGFPPVGGVAVKVSPTVIRNAAAYQTMQPDDAAERYTAEEFIAMQISLSDACWNDVAAFAREIRRGSSEVPKPSEAVTATSSGSASAIPSDTPST